jgi:hypothetical protein
MNYIESKKLMKAWKKLGVHSKRQVERLAEETEEAEKS